MSMTIPLLPESAPFNAVQRAWLNGFFAGLLGVNGENGHANGNGQGMPALSSEVAAVAAVAEVAEEDLPWHDPALPLDERLALAEGKPY